MKKAAEKLIPPSPVLGPEHFLKNSIIIHTLAKTRPIVET